MTNYYGPLVHVGGGDRSTVVDPRFGTSALPVQPAGWGGGGSEGTPSADNVDTYGAAGDGVTDDTAAFQACAAAGMGGARLALTPGKVYRLAGTVTIDVAKRRGINGQNARIISPNDVDTFRLVGTNTTGTANPTASPVALRDAEFGIVVENVKMRGPGPSAAQTGAAISMSGVMQVRITGCTIEQYGSAIRTSDVCRNLIIDGSHLYYCGRGIFFGPGTNLHQVIVAGNHISYHTFGILQDGGSDIHNALVMHNDLESRGNGAVSLVQVALTEKWQFVGNQFDDHGSCTGPLLYIGAGSGINSAPGSRRNVLITGNTFENALNGAVEVRAYRAVTVVGNTFVNNEAGATAPGIVTLTSTHAATVTGNTVDDCGGAFVAARGDALNGLTVADNSLASSGSIASIDAGTSSGPVKIAGNTSTLTGAATQALVAGTGSPAVDVSGNTVSYASPSFGAGDATVRVTATASALRVVGNQATGTSLGTTVSVMTAPTVGEVSGNQRADSGTPTAAAYDVPSASSSFFVERNLPA